MSHHLSVEDLTILLVEPSNTQRKIIVQRLQEAGIRKVDAVATGSDALAAMEIHVPDLVISSMYFGDMDGSLLIQEIRENPRLEDIPFMLITSERHPHNLESIRQAGVLAILSKPFRSEDLKRALYATVDFVDPTPLELEHVDVEDLAVLVVDDSLLSRRYLCQVLANSGIERITEAANGLEAADILGTHNFDLVVTDYNMPEMDGQALVEFIRQESSQPDLPVLMVTGEQDHARLASVRQAGVSALCDKPFDLTNLRHVVERLLTE